MNSFDHHLLMIHGLLGSMDYFKPEQHFDRVALHTPHLLGYGTNDSITHLERLDLKNQVRYLEQYIKDYIQEPCWVLGHSVGGAIAILLAGLNPDLIRGIISVEGNFTLNDAFWCQKIARLSLSEWSAQYLEIQHDPEAWLAHSGIPASPTYIDWANNILHHQSADTIWFMAQSVVCDTHHPSYLETVSCLLQRGIPIHLMAGERSLEDWDVPEWVRQQAQSSTVFSGAGHMIMLEQPSFFCHKVQSIMQCSYSTL